MNLMDEVAAAKAANDPARLTDVIPYARFLGLTAALDEKGLVCRLAGERRITGNPVLPAIHGGVIGALLESVAILHLLWEREGADLPKTVNISIDFLRSGRIADTFARAVITKQGRRVANVRAEAWQDDPDKPIASAHSHFLLT
jgi:uncharacterized protein (TIGR00369 family)